MKTTSTLLLALVLTSFVASAQKTRYFAPYFYAKSDKRTDYERRYVVKDHEIHIDDYAKGKHIRLATVNGTTNLDVVDDLLKYVSSNGQIIKENENFKNIQGTVQDLYENGQPNEEYLFKNDRLLTIQAWGKDGSPALTAGSGTVKIPISKSTIVRSRVYQDSLLVGDYQVRPDKGDTIFNKVDKVAEPKNGLEAFVKQMSGAIKYPSVAHVVGKQGRVFISFVVDEKGHLTEFEPLTTKGFNFEKKVIQQLELLPDWNPAVLRGRPVKMKFAQPVNYKLR